MGSEDSQGSSNKVWVAGLPFDIRQRDVVALISEFADIEASLLADNLRILDIH